MATTIVADVGSMTSGFNVSSRMRTVIAACVAFTFYAVWAAWANRMHDPASIGMAALAQGLYSALVTAAMTGLVERLFGGAQTLHWRVLRCTGATLVLLVVSSLAVHWLAGTAEVFVTVLPSWVFGSLYAFAYASGLARAERVARSDQK